MKKYKAIVNHTGACGGEHFIAGKETTLTEGVIKALGNNVRVLEEIQEDKKQEEKKEEASEKPLSKEAKKPLDKMVKKEEAVTK